MLSTLINISMEDTRFPSNVIVGVGNTELQSRRREGRALIHGVTKKKKGTKKHLKKSKKQLG